MDRIYAQLGDTELFNGARLKRYVEGGTNGITVKCDAPNLHVALDHDEYTDPVTDAAPWYKPSRPDTAKFLGLMAVKIEGVGDGTREITVTQLMGDGGVQSLPRDASGEMRVTALLVATDKAGMHEGKVWLKETLEGNNCDEVTLGCVGHTLRMFTAPPSTLVEYVEYGRNFYNVELLEGPKLVEELPSKHAVMCKVEWVLSIGKPWPTTDMIDIATLDMDDATNHTDAAGENCSERSVAYDNFINDPFFTAIAQPPRPPAILPPNILDIGSWRRRTTVIPASVSDRSGQVIPVVKIFAGPAAAQFVRVRFYRDEVVGATGCDYDGEFLVSYIPATSVMNLDGIRREISVTMPDGRVVPAGHLLFGTDGRPFQWPELGCHHTYTVAVDMMPGQADISVIVEAAVRE
jgi:hypothetical protein